MDTLKLSVICLVLRCVNIVFSCGISTHIEVAERAREFFYSENDNVDYKRLITRWQGAFEAGHSYPDAFYPNICRGGAYSDVAEDTHWTPFLNATVNYIRRTYPQPWGRDAERLVAFLFGIVQHQIADVTWHSLGISQGFLRTMGHVNYHGSFGAAHSDGDFGGDVLTQNALDMGYVGLLPTQWYVPTADLVEIYKEYYGAEIISEDVIQNCTVLLFLGRLGENIRVIETLYPFFSTRSPFLTERLQDYFLGGVDDMAVWTANTWRETVYMLDHGSSDCNLPNNPLYIECNTSKFPLRKQLSGTPEDFSSEIKGSVDEESFNSVLLHIDPEEVITTRQNGGIQMSLPEYSQTLLEEMLAEHFTYQKSDLNETGVIYPDIVYGTDVPYSRLGESLLSGDFNNDGHEDLVIGAPGYSTDNNPQRGCVYIVYGTATGLPSTELTLEDNADKIVYGQKLNGRFGQSLAVLDYNLDGLVDLVVGAPSVGSDTLLYQGEIYIYFGTLSGGLPEEPSITIGCTERYCNLGWSLSTGDLNADGHHDLVVGAPYAPGGGEQRGFVGVLYSKGTARCPDSTRRGDYGICENEFTHDKDCPLQRKCCFQMCANMCVDPIHINLETQLTESDFDWKMNGGMNYEWFGYSSVVHSTNNNGAASLVVGSPTYRKCASPGCVYNSEDVQSAGKVSVFNVPLSSQASHQIEGQYEFSQFGHSLASESGPLFDWLAIGAITEDVSGLQNGTSAAMRRAGQVYIYPDIHSEQPLYNLAADRQHSRFGSAIRFVDVNDDGTSDIVVGSPHRSISRRQLGRESGQVFIFDGRNRLGQQDAEEAEWILSIDESKSRFGTAVLGVRHLSKVQLVVSAPHSNFYSRLGGRVAIFKSL